jgi:hypothetical protein
LSLRGEEQKRQNQTRMSVEKRAEEEGRMNRAFDDESVFGDLTTNGSRRY